MSQKSQCSCAVLTLLLSLCSTAVAQAFEFPIGTWSGIVENERACLDIRKVRAFQFDESEGIRFRLRFRLRIPRGAEYDYSDDEFYSYVTGSMTRGSVPRRFRNIRLRRQGTSAGGSSDGARITIPLLLPIGDRTDASISQHKLAIVYADNPQPLVRVLENATNLTDRRVLCRSLR